ncbi:MAG: hypothetical protein WDM80_09100 [Limisphaerales bacterium]
MYSHNKAPRPITTIERAAASPATSPLSLNVTVTGNPARAYSPALVSNGSMTDYILTYQMPQYPGADDFNRMRGVRAELQLGAAAKVFATNGNSLLTWTAAAVDDLVAPIASRTTSRLSI